MQPPFLTRVVFKRWKRDPTSVEFWSAHQALTTYNDCVATEALRRYVMGFVRVGSFLADGHSRWAH